MIGSPHSARQDTIRTSYDSVAALYSDLARDALDEQPLDGALIAAFAELVRRGGGPVVDAGCGPGHNTARLRSLGLDTSGVDLSPEMIALARAEYPEQRFDEGSLTALDAADGALGGVLSWYSVIHLAPELLPEVLAEFHRVLAPGGHLLLGFFHAEGDEPEEFDHKVTFAYRLPLDLLAGLARAAGLTEIARMVREPGENERFLHGRLLLRRPG
ncbi:class I SAM-dependent methyltransferase [Spirillospora sp. NPDC029432]|uniref:class I SAM-dependent DNA methyltransferase n=1 Tax=Spirillospora sp. NPDC029432 TaxID=3154599 RepID=UPI003453EFE0